MQDNWVTWACWASYILGWRAVCKITGSLGLAGLVAYLDGGLCAR